MIGIIDYGMGNLYSVSKALERLNVPYIVESDQNKLSQADGFILPGVGSFKDAMHMLTETKLDSFIHEQVAAGKPLLGICLGMQLLFEESEENGLTAGLKLLPGRVVRFTGMTKEGKRYKVPHMGWNELAFHQSSPLFDGVERGHVYFVHSYYVQTDDRTVVLASAQYDVEVPAIVGRGKIFGTQFHPEKSGALGMRLLQNYARLVERERN